MTRGLRAIRFWFVHFRGRVANRAKNGFAEMVPAIALGGLTILAAAERVRTSWRRIRGKRPRVVWGASAILNIKYWSGAMRAQGYESTTCVVLPPAIIRREDFDVTREDLIARSRLPARFRDYAMFIWALRNGDVYSMHFDGGFLRFTPLESREFALLRLAGKKLIFSPYGGDIAVPGHLGHLEEALLADYPELPLQAELTTRRVLSSLRWADASILTIQPGFQPWFNVLWGNQLGIDTDMWPDAHESSGADGRNRPVSVVHAPNHRAIKGTEYLERAVDDLREDGLLIDLVVMEGRPNTEVREAILSCDIVADQFLFGYGLFATEGLAAGKPVLSNMSHLAEVFRESEMMRACPIVDSNPETVREDLRRLVENPELRGEIGLASREFVMRYHSYEAVGRDWAAIVRYVWEGRPLPEHLRPG